MHVRNLRDEKQIRRRKIFWVQTEESRSLRPSLCSKGKHCYRSEEKWGCFSRKVSSPIFLTEGRGTVILIEDVHPDDILDSLAILSEYGPLTLYPQNLLFPQKFTVTLNLFLFVRTMRKIKNCGLLYTPHTTCFFWSSYQCGWQATKQFTFKINQMAELKTLLITVVLKAEILLSLLVLFSVQVSILQLLQLITRLHVAAFEFWHKWKIMWPHKLQNSVLHYWCNSTKEHRTSHVYKDDFLHQGTARKHRGMQQYTVQCSSLIYIPWTSQHDNC